jgi:tRNA-intron endonuclease, archaea type
MLELELYGKDKVIVEDDSTRDILKRGFYGTYDKPELTLSVEEALYLLDVRNANCTLKGKSITFNELASKFWNSEKFIARYFTYKDWRDRGLVAVSLKQGYSEPNQTSMKRYPASSLHLLHKKLHGVFFKTDLMSILNEEEEGKQLYESLWFGQYGSYKAAERGRLNKLDIYETLFLADKGVLELKNITKKGLISYASKRRKEFISLYNVYKDWRERGYVIKTGFKFGTHFRVYFPGATPMKAGNGDWTHSKHVIHVFPKTSKLLISEWARAIRVAHSVRKTFILAVPGKATKGKQEPDYILYHRHGGESDAPTTSPPKYAMLSLGEEEYIGGQELADAINGARKRKLELLIAIADRETAVTYYKVRQIKLPNSSHDYFEIDWMQP